MGVQPSTVMAVRACHRCEKVGEADVPYYEFWFDKPCKRGVEARHRSLRAGDPSGKALEADVLLMKSDPPKWRIDHFAFRPEASGVERKMGHSKAKEEARAYNKAENFDEQKKVKDDCKIRRRHYWKWLQQFEDITEKFALDQFDSIHTDQGSDNDWSDGEEAIKVSKPIHTYRSEAGHRTATGSEQQCGTTDERHKAFCNSVRRSIHGVDGSGSEIEDVDVEAHLRESPSKTTDVASSVDGGSRRTAQPTLSYAASNVGGKKAASKVTASVKSGGKSTKKVVSTDVLLSPIDLGVDALDAVEPQDMDGPQFLNAKKAMKHHANEMLALVVGKNSMDVHLKKAQARLVQYKQDDADCPFRTPELIDSVQEIAVKVQAFFDKAKKSTVENLAELRKDRKSLTKGANDFLMKYQNQMKSLQVKMVDAVGDYKSEYQTQYWVEKSYYDTIISTGHAPAWAKTLSVFKFHGGSKTDGAEGVLQGAVIVNPRTPSEFFTNCVTLFRGGGGSLVQHVRGLVCSQREVFEEKETRLAEALVLHDKWPGCSGIVGAFVWDPAVHKAFFGGTPGREVFVTDATGKPWMRTFHNNSKNTGASLGMVQGCAGLMWSFEASVTVVGMPIDPLVKIGITPDTYEDFFTAGKTEKAVEMLKKHSFMIEMKPLDFLFLPVGYIWHAFVYERRPKESGKKWKPGQNSFCHIPLKLPMEEISAASKEAIKDSNNRVFEIKPKGMWKARKAFFDEIVKISAT